MKGSERCFLASMVFGGAVFAGNLHVADSMALGGLALMLVGAAGFVWRP